MLADSGKFNFRFLLPSRERASVRGHRSAEAPSPLCKPIMGEEVKLLRRLVGLGIVLLLETMIPSSAHAENIKIGLPSITITAMPFFVAKEHGFFQQEGLSAEMVVMPASLNIKVLLAGDIQYAATIGSAVAAAIRGINVRTVMLFVDRPLQDLVGAPGITSVGDLKAKVVAISSRGGLQAILCACRAPEWRPSATRWSARRIRCGA